VNRKGISWAAGLKPQARPAENTGAMPYVYRNSDGRIIGLSDATPTGKAEELDLSHPEVLEFLQNAKNELSSTDSDTIRVIEDLVDVLIRKKLILLTDLPVPARQKLSERQRIRNELNVLDNLMVGEEDIL
jgi:hypothetical protein